MPTVRSQRVPPEADGQRLDKFLGRLLPDMGLRGRRRLCAAHRVLVNQRPAPEAYKVRAGDVVALASGPEEMGEHIGLPSGALRPLVVEQTEHLAAVFKPAGLHTVQLAGGPAPSVEFFLPRLVQAAFPFPRLLNRLDWATSGLVLAALTQDGESTWVTAPPEKRYLALLQGRLTDAITVTTYLETSGSQRVKATEKPELDARRHTRLVPLGTLPAPSILNALALPALNFSDDSITLAGCTIVQGRRHQIRAHAASYGIPLLGDVRYGARKIPSPGESVTDSPWGGEYFFLHHGAFRLADFSASYPPLWLTTLPETWRIAALHWLKGVNPRL